MALKNCVCGKKLGPATRSCPHCGHDFVKTVIGFVPEEEYEENTISDKKLNQIENCLTCSEDYEVVNYYKVGNNFYYYNATGNFCRLTCLLKSDLDKSKIILQLLNKFSDEEKQSLVEELKKEFSNSLIESLFKSPKQQYKEINYRNKIPDFDSKEDRQLRMFEFKKKNNIEISDDEKEKYEKSNSEIIESESKFDGTFLSLMDDE